MKSGMKITTDKTAKVAEALRKATLNHVLIGIPSDKKARRDKDGHGAMDNATIGYINENGSEAASIPPRPHLVPGVAAVHEKTTKLLGDGIKAALTGDEGGVDNAFVKAGLVAQASVKNTLKAGEGFAALAESTLYKRVKAGFVGDKPLIWTGQYMNSITFVVRKR